MRPRFDCSFKKNKPLKPSLKHLKFSLVQKSDFNNGILETNRIFLLIYFVNQNIGFNIVRYAG